jgi:hypothetical protein
MRPPPAAAGERLALWAHAAPFVAWLLIMQVAGQWLGWSWSYLLQVVVCTTLFLILRPWRWYTPPNLRHLPLALAVGILVFVVWILPEMAWSEAYPGFRLFYFKAFVNLPPGGPLPDYLDGTTLRHLAWPTPEFTLNAPYLIGWPLTLVRLAGSAFVIAVIEEFFWRGFLYRWLIGREFRLIGLREFDLQAFLIMVALFGVEHDRWLVGMLAGAAYGGLVLLTGSLWPAVVAHVVTNYLLGLYVLASGNYGFW